MIKINRNQIFRDYLNKNGIYQDKYEFQDYLIRQKGKKSK